MAKQAVGVRAEADRSLAHLALTSGDWDASFFARKFTGPAVRATREELERTMRPLIEVEAKLDGSLAAKVRNPLKAIGAKVRPDLSPDQARQWFESVTLALADLPPHIAAKSVEDALHTPFEFLSAVEAKVREFAETRLEAQRRAIRRCQLIEEAVHNATHRQQIEDKRPEPNIKDGEVLTDAQVHDLQRVGGMAGAALRLGLTKGYILQSQLLPEDQLPEEGTYTSNPEVWRSKS